MESQNYIWFKDYRVSSRLATGGMAEVFLAWRFDRASGEQKERVALKKLLPHLLRDRSIVQMFVNEAKIIAQIHHPNVVRIIDLGNESGEWFIAMELLEGRSFADLRTRAAEMGKRVPLGITLRVLTDACRGLDAAHRARDESGRELRIVHRDFTPDNVHVGVDGQVKVIDFGIAKAANVGAGTEPGTLKGKFFYMSPEMIAGHAVDHRADLFAAGVMMYEQLCGRRPFTGSYSDEVLARIAEGRPKRPTEFDPSVPPALEEICLKALRKDPDARFPSLLEFVQAIEAVGGAAALASPAQVGGYVSELFPPDIDEKRKTLRQARMADPSLPNAPRDSGPQLMAEPELFGVNLPPPPPFPLPPPPGSQPGTAPVSPSAVEGQRGGLSEVPSTSLRTGSGRRTPQSKKPLIIGGAVALLLIAAAGAFFLMPKKSPTERLTAAAAVKTADERSALLSPLASDERVTAKEYEKACVLLGESKAWTAMLDVATAFGARFPKDIDAALFEARAAIALRQGKRAQTAVERALTIAPNDPRPELLLADLAEAQADLPGAIDALTKALKKNPKELQLAFKLGYFQSQAGRLEDAEATLGPALQKKFDAAAAAELGFVKFRKEQDGEALRLLKSALAKDRQLAKGYYYLGAVLFKTGDVNGAEKAYRDADRLAPEDPRALASLCELLAHKKDDSGIAEVKKQMETRFAEDAPKLVGHCSGPSRSP